MKSDNEDVQSIMRYPKKPISEFGERNESNTNINGTYVDEENELT